MKRTVSILLVVCMMAFTVTLWAQQGKKKAAGKAESTTTAAAVLPKAVRIPVYLGHSSFTGGRIPKQVFDSLLKQGLTAHDSLGVAYRVLAFDINYAESQMYEDSVGNLMRLTDYQLEFCPGDTITAGIAASIYQRTKEGDTMYFDHIKLAKFSDNVVYSSDSNYTTGKGMIFEISK